MSTNYTDTITLGTTTTGSPADYYNHSVNTGIYSNRVYMTNNTWDTFTSPNHSELSVIGNAEISGSLKVGGKDIAESLKKIEDRLAILHPNKELEEKWENLRGLRKMYMELEAEIIEKEKIYNILKT